MDEIGKLRRSKKMAAGVDKKGEQAGLTEKRVDDLRAEIKEFDNELNAIKEEQVSCTVPFSSRHCALPGLTLHAMSFHMVRQDGAPLGVLSALQTRHSQSTYAAAWPEMAAPSSAGMKRRHT